MVSGTPVEDFQISKLFQMKHNFMSIWKWLWNNIRDSFSINYDNDDFLCLVKYFCVNGDSMDTAFRARLCMTVHTSFQTNSSGRMQSLKNLTR